LEQNEIFLLQILTKPKAEILFYLVFLQKMVKHFLYISLILSFCTACGTSKKVSKTNDDSYINPKAKTFTKLLKIDRNEFVGYAKTFLGVRYKYGSAEPSKGLDCSGFVTVVFKHFKVQVPRVSKDFTNEGMTVSLQQAKPGDIILFTGSDNSSGIVGHMGIITSSGKEPEFINSSSGKNIGVIISKVSGYWKTHFVKVIRVLQ
jgi:cell wall-associated NlpC family hydrolase